MKKRMVSTLMALCMVLTLLPVQVLAAGGAAPQHRLDNTTIGQYTTLGNGVYTLAEDVSISSTLEITGEATLDLNGNTLTMTGDQKAISVGGGAKLTLRDSGTDGMLTAPGARGVTVAESGTLVMEGGSIVGCQAGNGSGGGVYNSGTFIMKSGTISGCKGSSGGGVYNSYGTFTMEGGSISQCKAEDEIGIRGDGDGVYNSGTFTMSDSAEISLATTSSGVYNTGTMNANGGSIETGSSSTALHNNGAGTVQTESGSTGTVFRTWVTNEGVISGGVFEDQVTSKRGTISGGKFQLAVSIQGETTVTGGVFEGDVSIQGGTVSGGTFKGKVTKHVNGTISGGTFEETSDVLSYGTIDPGVAFPGKVTVTYMADGAVYAQHFLKHGATARQPAGPNKTDYTFDGWLKADGTAYDFKQPVTENITLTAKWKVTSYTDVSSETELRDALTQERRASGWRMISS